MLSGEREEGGWSEGERRNEIRTWSMLKLLDANWPLWAYAYFGEAPHFEVFALECLGSWNLLSLASTDSLSSGFASTLMWGNTSGDHKFAPWVMNECQDSMNVCCQKSMIVCLQLQWLCADLNDCVLVKIPLFFEQHTII